MTNMERVLGVLNAPMSVEKIAEATRIERRSVSWALSKLRKHECVRSCGGTIPKGGGYAKFWIATGKPFVPTRAAPSPRLFVVEVQPHRKAPGSGVIAPRPYAYGYLWSNR